jgi:two-component system, OmpR family, sensor histidine kinase TctE
MIRGWPQSLQVRLALRVAGLYIVATVVVIVVLMSRAYDTARSLGDQELLVRANDLARYVTAGEKGLPRLELPPNLSAIYQPPSDSDIFAIRDASGRIIAAAPPQFGELVAGWPSTTSEPVRFGVRLDAEPGDFDGLSVSRETVTGVVSISVGRSSAGAAAAYSLMRKFIHDTIWAVSILVLASLVVGIFGIRSGLRPVRNISEMAAAIGPHAMSVRLPDKGLPSEISPLVTAVNRALDRVEQGFTIQREFTANAAHELRTPLAIITAALEEIDGDDDFVELKADVARMNRLVEQLLRVARLDAIVLDVTGVADLNEVAGSVVATIAPWALARDRTIAFKGFRDPVLVKGNRHAIGDAIRNLIENAVLHSPARSEVLVRTSPDGRVSVADRGPGIIPADQERIFDRFWRGKGVQFEGAGLGLAIVKEIMNAHGGRVSVENRSPDGAIFTLHFTTVNRENEELSGMSPANA